MKNIKTIFLKELKRYFTEPRMLAALYLPGIIIFLVYSLMGKFVTSAFSPTSQIPQDYTYRIVATNNNVTSDSSAPLLFENLNQYIAISEKTNKADYHYISLDEVDEYKDAIKDHQYDVLVVFEDKFDESIYQEGSEKKVNISLFYDGSSQNATYLYTLLSSLLTESYTNYTVNLENGAFIDANLSTENYTFKNVMSFVIPLVTISLLFSTVISICPEAIAGEKERGTLASLLMTPIKRSELALGKISALTLISLTSGTVSFLGLIFSLPSLYGTDASIGIIFSAGSFIMLLLLMITSLILFVTLGLLISTFAKSIKEAGSYLTPLMTILMISAVIPFAIDMSNIGFAFIPLLNIVSSMNLIITESNLASIVPYLAVTVSINIIFSGLLVFLSAKMFNNENIMFQR